MSSVVRASSIFLSPLFPRPACAVRNAQLSQASQQLPSLLTASVGHRSSAFAHAAALHPRNVVVRPRRLDRLSPRSGLWGEDIGLCGRVSAVSKAPARRSAVTSASAAPQAPAPAVEGEVKTERRKRVISGVQPTGKLHLGNYLGAVRNWVDLQITLPHDPVELRDATLSSAAMYIACGIDPAKASIFVQSHVTAHAEMTWLLNCVTPIGWLERMIQYKEKSNKEGVEVGAGLLTYPVLMASDILLYQTDLVPVGEDQRQHLELARDIATRVNSKFGGRPWKKLGGRGGKIFTVPDAFIPKTGARVMSLTDGKSKMSKSATSDASRINLLDTPEDIAQKIKRCKTDSFVGMELDNPERPECTNLLNIYQVITGQTREAVIAEMQGLNWGSFKPRLTDALVAHLGPIQARYQAVRKDPTFLSKILKDGADTANKQAQWTLSNLYEAMGFVPPFR
eukprot:jgi/Mesvir1/10870/Mv14210-RA.2